jgi:hypothetical protein
MSNNLLGDDYPYYKNIKSPGELGMSSKGDISTLTKDVSGLIEYVKVLVSGSSKASKTGKPLGNKYFLNTSGATCMDTATNTEVPRYIYINNVPQGNIPLLSSGTGINFSDFKGLIPGTISDLSVLDPTALMSAFTTGATPPCQKITLQTINSTNQVGSESNYVAIVDIKSMDPCSFPNKKNPITGQKCKEGFESYMSNNVASNAASVMMPGDPIVQLYYSGLALFGIYILYRLMDKQK